MPPQVSEAQSEILHEQIVPAFLAILDDAPPLEDPAELELLAATVLAALEQPELPADAVYVVIAAIEARREPAAAGVLAAPRATAGGSCERNSHAAPRSCPQPPLNARVRDCASRSTAALQGLVLAGPDARGGERT